MGKNNKNCKQEFIIPEHIVKEMQKAAQAMRPLIALQNQISKSFEPLHKMTQQIHKSFTPIFEQQRKFTEFAERIRKQKRAERETFLKSGWWFTPSMMGIPASWISQAVNEYQNGNKTAIVNLFRRIYQRENCKNLETVVINWKKNRFFAPWRKHLDDAFDAHKDKKYILSVPVLLLTAEGIATDFCKKKGIYREDEKSKGGEKIKKAIRQYYGQSNHILLSDLDLLEGAIDSTIYKNTDLIKKKLRTNILNRHSVLHGVKKNYGTMKVSLQAFMLLDVLSELK